MRPTYSFPEAVVEQIAHDRYHHPDPKALAAWYREHLGIPVEPGQTHGVMISAGAGEMTVWSSFPADTQYFGRGPATIMVNYRVTNLGRHAGAAPCGGRSGRGLRLRPLRLGDRPRRQSVRVVGAEVAELPARSVRPPFATRFHVRRNEVTGRAFPAARKRCAAVAAVLTGTAERAAG